MTDFKEFSARFAQSVCILTFDNFGEEKSCTISSFSSVSASTNLSIFSFSLTQNSFMAGIMRENYEVTVTLLSQSQSRVADYYVKNRFDSGEFSMGRVVDESIGVLTGKIFKSMLVGSSILYLAEVQEVKFVEIDSKPLVYRLRSYGW